MRNKNKKYTQIILYLFALAVLAGCNMPGAASKASTMDATQAYQTVEARLTQAVVLTPSSTPRPSKTPGSATTEAPLSPTLAPTTPPPPAPSKTAVVQSCDQAAAGNPLDVTVPDDTTMEPEQDFTKTWRLVNTGTCTWSTDYTIAVFSGDELGAPSSVRMPKKVAPGQSVDISVDMVAPTDSGTYQGNWKLRNASQTWFGIGPAGGSPFWVRIIVGEGQTTRTPTVTATSSDETPEATSSVQASGSVDLLPNDGIDLDSGQVSTGGESDLAYTMNTKQALFISHANGSSLGVYGDGKPSLSDCENASLGGGQINLNNLHQNQYLCYQTNQGLYGWIRLLGLNSKTYKLTIQFLTWASP